MHYFQKKREEKKAKKIAQEYIQSLNPKTNKELFQENISNIFKHKFFYLILIPAIILLLIFAYQPMYGIVIAFKDFSPRKGIMGSAWVGMKNFEDIFNINGFWNALQNTLVINVLKLVFGFPASILLAVMINSIKNKFFKNTIQTAVYLPHFLSWVVVAGMIFSLLDDRTGSLYKLLDPLFDLNVFSDGPQFIALLVISDIWKSVGFGAIIYLAALSGVSQELYEAAELDGANSIQKFFRVTLPQILPTISIMLILRVGGLIGGGFDQVFNLYNPTLYEHADILDTFIYRYGIGEGNFEMGTAIGLFSNLINIILLFSANKIVELINKVDQ